jgi:hypothetical protein
LLSQTELAFTCSIFKEYFNAEDAEGAEERKEFEIAARKSEI